MSKEIAEEYASSLGDLTVNSKPLINMLTILAEENIEHAGTIVETVEKHLEKVPPEIKLPVLYLVDSIIKNVGGAYTQKFSQSIVNMFTRTFKQVDEKIRSQMFKLRETWHDVFPATKLYQLDVKVNLIDPAWPIQAQPQQANIHVNPNFLKKPVANSSVPVLSEEEEKMRSIVAKKEQELLMLKRKKIEMELEKTKRQLEMANPKAPVMSPVIPPITMPVAMVNPVAPMTPMQPDVPIVPVKQRLGPPVNRVPAVNRIAPVSGALAAARRDPRLARRPPQPQQIPQIPPPPQIAANVFDIKPLERVTKRKNVITIDVNPETTDTRPPRRDPRLNKTRREKAREKRREEQKVQEKLQAEEYVDRLQIPDVKKISKLPPIPKINREDKEKDKDAVPNKRKKEQPENDKKKRRDDSASSKGSSSGSSPEKRHKNKGKNQRNKNKERIEVDEEKQQEPEKIAFKELKNYNKERYMRRNKEKSESPEKPPVIEVSKPIENNSSNAKEVVTDTKDVDLRVLHPVVADTKAAPIAQKRPSTENSEGKAKKSKHEKFDILFGNEDVDLRQLPQVEETCPPPPNITDSPPKDKLADEDDKPLSPISISSPKKDWNEVKSKTPSKLDLVRAKLADVTKGKDRIGRPTLFNKSPSLEKERKRTLSSEDTDLRQENSEELNAEDHKKTINIIMTQAKEQFKDGQLDKNQYNTLMFQVLQLNEKLKLKEAKQRESLEISKRKLKAQTFDENHKVQSPKSSPNEHNKYGDIDERITPAAFIDNQTDGQAFHQDSDMRVSMIPNDIVDGPNGPMPRPPMPMFMNNFGPIWRPGMRPRMDEYMPRRMRLPFPPPGFRGKFDKRGPRPFEPRPPLLPAPKLGVCQGECPLKPYERSSSPPPLGAPGYVIPPTDYNILEYIDQDPVKTIQIDGIPREIIFYDDTAVIMLEWDDPREIKFLPGSRRVTFDNKDSVVLSFNEGYKQIEIDDQVFDIRFGAPTRELYINGRWYECYFGVAPVGMIIDGKPHLVHLEGPLPQVDIGKVKRTDLVAGKINLIVDAMHMCPVFLDSKVQKFNINGMFFTIRFVDALRTVLINEQPFKVEFGGLPKPMFIGNQKHFIRFSVLPRHIKPGLIEIANMEGYKINPVPLPSIPLNDIKIDDGQMEVDQEEKPAPVRTPSPEGENQGLDMLASVMPSSLAPASGSEYTVAEPLFLTKTDKIPGLDTSVEEKPANPTLPIDVTDLFAKLVATGIVQVPSEVKDNKVDVKEDVKAKLKEDKSIIHKVDLLKPETLKVKQPGLVAKLYGGMQCSGCGTRFPPEHTVRYSQHLDWHFRQNRRERDSARRAHSRHWHYDLSDWLQWEELDELEDREKSWFESEQATEEGERASPPPSSSVPAGAGRAQSCALCGDRFEQFYSEEHEEWHLRSALEHAGHHYHPLCFHDLQASQNKEEEVKTDPVIEPAPVEKTEDLESIEIKEIDEINELSDNEVEVVEPESKEQEPLEIDEGDEDDVVFKADPVEQVVVEDDEDTDDETQEARRERDKQAEFDFSKIKIKQEPIDPDDEPIITAEVEPIIPIIDTTRTTVHSSIDGNVQLDTTPAPVTNIPSGGIRINISKAVVPSITNNNQDDKMFEDVSVDDEPLPPGEEPELEYKLKPNLEGVQFSRQPPVKKGKDLSGLCSIM